MRGSRKSAPILLRWMMRDGCGRRWCCGKFAPIPNCAEIQKLYLSDAVRGRGYGKELMRLAETWSREAGYRQLYLETHSNLQIAIKLYKKLGFTEIERPKEVLHSTMDHFYIKQL